MNKSFVLECNKERIIMNYICNYEWFDKDFSNSFEATLKHYNNMDYVVNDITNIQVREYLVKYILSLSNNNNFNSFIDRLKEQDIVNSFKELMIKEELPFKNKQQLQLYIINKLLPSIYYV